MLYPGGIKPILDGRDTIGQAQFGSSAPGGLEAVSFTHGVGDDGKSQGLELARPQRLFGDLRAREDGKMAKGMGRWKFVFFFVFSPRNFTKTIWLPTMCVG